MRPTGLPPHHAFHPETSSISEGFDPALSVMAVRPPIYPVSTFAFTSAAQAERWFQVALGKVEARPGEAVGLIYARLNHPNAEMFEDALRSVEQGATAAAAFTSGMAAITTTVLTFAKPGRKLLYQRPVYGGTDHFFRHMLPAWNIQTIAVDEGGWDAALQQHGADLDVVYLETPANPTLRMIDLGRMRARLNVAVPDRRVTMLVDNTFLGPVFQAPLLHGADVAVYSATKFLGGHSDLVAGAITAADPSLIGKVKETRAFLGTICEPFTAWMLQRSMATLWLRMTQQAKNAVKIVDMIKAHPAVDRVHHPTQFVGEQAQIFQKQCTGAGSMVAIELKGGREAAFRFLDALRLIRLAVSLGGVESLATHPRTTTASEMSDEDLAISGITDGLVRLSIGVEEAGDLSDDIRQALDAALGQGAPAT